MVRDERDQWIKEVSFRKRRVRAWEGKVRAARVLQQYTPQGHSLLTWACCLGIEQIVEELLDHGACPGVPDVVLAEASRSCSARLRTSLMAQGTAQAHRGVGLCTISYGASHAHTERDGALL